MASRTSSIPQLLNSPLSLPYPSQSLSHHKTKSLRNQPWFQAQTRLRNKPIFLTIVNAQANYAGKEEVVIIGAGIAGLATAVSLQRLGIRTKVLEQAESLRTGGTSLTLFKNGWSVLDAIGVGNQLRSQFLEIQGMVIKSDEGRELRSFRFKDADESQEVRAVERRILLETLADQLPPDSISFSSKLSNIEKKENGEILLEFDNGNQLSPEIVIACDGIRSTVAKWMGFPDAKYVGHCCFRGLGLFPDGQPFEPRVNYIYGRGVRAGFVPVSPTKVYWFICFNSSSPGGFLSQRRRFRVSMFQEPLTRNQVILPYSAGLKNSLNCTMAGPKITDPSVLRQQTKELVGKMSSDLLNLIDATPDDTLIRNPLVDRWLWPVVSPSASRGRAVLVGDAWHPMTPNLGQGACCALEDAVVLSTKLAAAIKSESASVEDAFGTYEKERWGRIFPLTIRSNLVGNLLQWEDPLVCSVRNNIVIPKLGLGPVLEHTNVEFEPLQRN